MESCAVRMGNAIPRNEFRLEMFQNTLQNINNIYQGYQFRNLPIITEKIKTKVKRTNKQTDKQINKTLP